MAFLCSNSIFVVKNIQPRTLECRQRIKNGRFEISNEFGVEWCMYVRDLLELRFCGQKWPTTDTGVTFFEQTVYLTVISDENGVDWHTTSCHAIDKGDSTTSGLEVSQSGHTWSDRSDFWRLGKFTSRRVFWYVEHFSPISRSTSNYWNHDYPQKKLILPISRDPRDFLSLFLC